MRKLNSLHILLAGIAIVGLSMFLSWNLPWREVKIKSIPITCIGILVMMRAVYLVGKGR